jgi:hypothetical protein
MDSAFKDKFFTSFNELQNAIQEYEEKNCVQLYKRTSRFRKLARLELATSTATYSKKRKERGKSFLFCLYDSAMNIHVFMLGN